MLSRKLLGNVFMVVLLSSCLPLWGQSPATAKQDHLPLTIGAGVANYSLDWGHDRREWGYCGWAEYRLDHMSPLLRGFRLVGEGHGIVWDPPSTLPNFKEVTFLAGASYQIHIFRRYHPYAKYVMGVGRVASVPGLHPYMAEHKTVTAFGGGLDYDLSQHVGLRADYQNQVWSNFSPDGHALSPGGVSVGLVYRFGVGRLFEDK